MKKTYIILALIVIILSVAAGSYFLLRPKKVNLALTRKAEPPISDILYLTNTVTDFTGKVDKVTGNTVFVSGKYSISAPPTPAYMPTAAPGQVITVPPLPPSKVFTYKINITSHTIITKPDLSANYLIKKITPTPTPKLTIKDIRTGQKISVTTSSDLRTLKSDEFDALTVKLPPINNTISGKISQINLKEGLVVLKAIPPVVSDDDKKPGGEEPKEKEYVISVSEDTEISRMGPAETAKPGATAKPPAPLKYQLSDLKTDLQITVYTKSDVIENQKLEALRIEPPADLVPASLISPTPQPTVTPKNP